MTTNQKLKQCRVCKEKKPIEDFNKDGKYIRGDCKKCYVKAKTRRRRSVQNWLKNYKETLACSVCGYSKKTHSNFCSRALEFHHNKKNKSFSVSNGVNRGRSKETVQKEIDKCIVVCSRCHAEIHASLK
jgi:hypothetical protein